MDKKKSEPTYGFYTERDVMITMRDGIKLATDIYFPCHGDGTIPKEKLPTLLVRTSYDKTAPEWDDIYPFFSRRGYVFVIQDLRSRFRSEGDGKYFHAHNPWEGDDGYDTIEWLAKQEWSNKKIGTLGSSHRGIVQQQLALKKPPHLSAMWVEAAPTNPYLHECREGGAMALQMFAAIHLHALDCHEIGHDKNKAKEIMDAMRNMRDWIQKFPDNPFDTALKVAPSIEQTAKNYLLKSDYDEWWDGDYANQEKYFNNHADVPLMIACGYYDNFIGASSDYYKFMNKKNKSDTSIIIGPWCHGGMRAEGSSHGDADTGIQSVWGVKKYNEERLNFFDKHLKNIDTKEKPKIRLYVMGHGDGKKTTNGNLNHGGVWRDETEWPLERTEYNTLFLTNERELSQFLDAEENSKLTYIFDPNNPVPTIGGQIVGMFEIIPEKEGGPKENFVPDFLDQWTLVRNNMREVISAAGWHQKESERWIGAKKPYKLLRDRNDVISFETKILNEDTEVTGEIVLKLWVSSDCLDTDFTFKLLDIYPESSDYPEGYHLNITDTILRMRYRDSWTKPELLTPDKPYEISVKLWPISNLFKKGHKIRLDISSSNYPRFDVNPNTGEKLGFHTKKIIANNTIYTNDNYPSRIILPIVKN